MKLIEIYKIYNLNVYSIYFNRPAMIIAEWKITFLDLFKFFKFNFWLLHLINFSRILFRILFDRFFIYRHIQYRKFSEFTFSLSFKIQSELIQIN